MSQTPFFSQSKRREGVIHSALVSINNALEQSIFAERTSRLDGLLQRFDPRLKLISILVLLVAANLARQPLAIACLYLFTIVLAAASRISIWVFVKRVWLTVFIFTALIALPALFITPGEVLWQIAPGIAVTRTGALSALLLLLRACTSVSLAVLLVLTTSWNNVLRAMGVLRVPDVILLTLGMTYRYIHLLLHTTNDMFLSRQSRILRPQSGAESRQLLAATSGVLLSKSLQLSSDIYLAMESRGFRDFPRTLELLRLRWYDWTAAAVVLLVAAITVWAGR